MSDSDNPGFVEGLKGIVLEPYYTVFGPAVKCGNCREQWRGYYAQYMNYCHFCAEELIKDE